MMIHMLALTCRQSLSFLSISTTISHSVCTIRFIATSELFSTASWIHMCICACMCVYLLFVCVSRCNTCVFGRQWKKENVRNWMLRIHCACISILGCAFAVKNEFHRWMYEKQTWTSSGPCVLQHTSTKAYIILQQSPFHHGHVSSSGF